MIRFERLQAGYEGIETLHGVDLTVPAGKLTALIGPNGCGKSTLFKACAGLLKPDSGRIILNGSDISALSPRQLAKILAYMPQSRPVPEMTVGQLAAHGRYPHLKWGRSLNDADRAAIRSALEMTGTLPLQNKRLDRLSGGERQRAYLAMMLAQQAPVMLLDEPAAALDLKAQFSMLALLKTLAAEGRTVFAVMHEINLALDYCENIILMNGGKIVAAGTPGDVLASGLLQSVFGVGIECEKHCRFVPAAE